MRDSSMRKGRVIIVGGSRGIGAATALTFARAGFLITLTYKTYEDRALAVSRRIIEAGGCASVRQLDVTDGGSIVRLVQTLGEAGPIHGLILSASGGLERGVSEDYAWKINVLGQLNVVCATLPLANSDFRILYLTSHEAHVFGSRREPYGPYARIAASKREGADALLELIPHLARRGARLGVLSADIVTGTVTAKLLERRDPGLLARRAAQVGRLPSPEDVAEQALSFYESDFAQGEVRFVWGLDDYYLA